MEKRFGESCGDGDGSMEEEESRYGEEGDEEQSGAEVNGVLFLGFVVESHWGLFFFSFDF